MITLDFMMEQIPPPFAGINMVYDKIPEHYRLHLFASNLADFPEWKRQDAIVWAFKVGEELTNLGQPTQVIIRYE